MSAAARILQPSSVDSRAPQPPRMHRGHLRLRRTVRSSARTAGLVDQVPLAPHRLARHALVYLEGRGALAQVASSALRPLTHLSVHGVAEAIVDRLDARARARHGWAPVDAWNMCSSVPRNVGQQLGWLAEAGMSWPPGEEFPTAESWRDTLRYHALILTTDGYGDTCSEQRLLDAWCRAEEELRALVSHKDTTTAQVESARVRCDRAAEQMQAAERLAAASVVSSMSWVAEHIHQLWD